MTSAQERDLITPCGIYCGSCPLYVARTDKELRKKIAEGQGIPTDKVVVCAGCRPMRGLVAPLAGTKVACETYTCAVNDKKVDFCYECGDFPCLKLAPCADRAQEIPHNTKIYHLLLIKKLGVDAWLEKYPTLVKQYRRGKQKRAGGSVQT